MKDTIDNLLGKVLIEFRKTCFEVRDDIQSGFDRSDDIVKAHAQAKSEIKQALLKDMLGLIGEEKSFERLYDDNVMEFRKDGKHYTAVPLYSAVMNLKKHHTQLRQEITNYFGGGE